MRTGATGWGWWLVGNGGFVDMRNGNTRGNHLLKTTNLLRGRERRCRFKVLVGKRMIKIICDAIVE